MAGSSAKTLLLVALACLACQPPAATPPPTPQVPDAAVDASRTTVGLLRRQHVDHWAEIVCGGVWVGPNTLLTTHHCAAAGTRTLQELQMTATRFLPAPPILGRQLRYVDFDEWARAGSIEPPTQRAVVTALDYDSDLALLTTEDRSRLSAPLRRTDLSWGERVFTVGHPGGAVWTLSQGIVSSRRRTASIFVDSAPERVVQFQLHVDQGSSGGGVWDVDGHLVSVMSSKLKGGSGHSFGPHPDALREFLFQ